MKRSPLPGAVCVCVFIFLSTATSAALVDNGGGLIYNDDLNITWTANANINGQMDWSNANTWAAGLTLGGVTGWRLPTTLESDTTCTDDAVGTTPSPDAEGWNCTGSEMGHLFYNELGGTAGDSILNSSDPDINLFSSIQIHGHYWSSTEFTADTDEAYLFRFGINGGSQTTVLKTQDFRYAWAVHDGNIVPIPAAVWLFGSGLLGLVGMARRKKAA